jgi:hypothetical protein
MTEDRHGDSNDDYYKYYTDIVQIVIVIVIDDRVQTGNTPQWRKGELPACTCRENVHEDSLGARRRGESERDREAPR